MTAGHGDRAHSAWSASASVRNWACPGSMRLCATIAEPRESEAAAWGTACHQLSEKALTNGKDAADYIGTTEHTKSRSFEVDEELAETAQVYIDYVRAAAEHATWCKLEERFSLDALKPPFEAGGTADATLWTQDAKLLGVVDLKGGRGVFVDVHENKQLRTYALGALLAHQGLAVERVKVTIVQPRIQNQKGIIRSEEFHVMDLMEWTHELLDAMHKAVAPDAPLVAGPHCTSTFCRAAAVCPALYSKVMEVARMNFQDETLVVPNTPDTLMPEDIASILDHADMIQGWLNAVRAYAHEQAESGVVIPNYILVDKQARPKWVNNADVEGALDLLGLEPEKMYAPRKLKTPNQIAAALGKKRAAEVPALKGLWSNKSSGKNLVRADKTNRTARKPAVAEHFDVLA